MIDKITLRNVTLNKIFTLCFNIVDSLSTRTLNMHCILIIKEQQQKQKMRLSEINKYLFIFNL